jgi:hypothetical protein
MTADGQQRHVAGRSGQGVAESRWVRESPPDIHEGFRVEEVSSDSLEGGEQARGNLINEWKDVAAKDPPADSAVAGYDTSARRAGADREMAAAGVPDDARHARTTADLLNGTDPQRAAGAGSKTKARPNRVRLKQGQQRSR